MNSFWHGWQSPPRCDRGEPRTPPLRAGQPIGLLTKEGDLYLLMEEEHDARRDGLTNFRQAAIEIRVDPIMIGVEDAQVGFRIPREQNDQSECEDRTGDRRG